MTALAYELIPRFTIHLTLRVEDTYLLDYLFRTLGARDQHFKRTERTSLVPHIVDQAVESIEPGGGLQALS